jgi:hypothetical protein
MNPPDAIAAGRRQAPLEDHILSDPCRDEVVSMGLDRNQHQGLFGESFVRVLASAAGLIVARAELDVTGEDLTISYKGVLGHTRHPKIGVQVKSWSRPVCRGEQWPVPAAGAALGTSVAGIS